MISVEIRDAVNKYTQLISFYCLCAFPFGLAVARPGGDYCASIIAVLFLLRSYVIKDWSWLKRKDIQIALIIVAYMALISVIKVEEFNALKSMVYIRFVLFYAAVTHYIVRTDKELKTVCWAATASIVYVFIDSMFQFFFERSLFWQYREYAGRLSGPLSHYNVANYLLKLSVPVLGALLIISSGTHKPKIRNALLLLVACVIITVPISGERSIFVLLIAATAVVSAYLLLHGSYKKQLLCTLVAIIAVFAGLYLSNHVFNMRLNMLLSDISNFWDTYYGEMFMNSYILWTQNPLFGVGFKNFLFSCHSLYNEYGYSYCDTHPHNIYMHWLSEFGAVGVLLFLGFAGLLLKTIWGNKNIYIKLVLLAAFTLLFFPIVTTQNMFSNWPGALFWYTLTVMMLVHKILPNDR